jgi:type I restriction enzyme S subunit
MSKKVPTSVQFGHPVLGKLPEGWVKTKFKNILDEKSRPAKLSSNGEYKLVNAKRARGGIYLRDLVLGKSIKTKTQFEIKHGDFLISKRQIIHGACGIVPKELDGAIVSNEYSVLNPKDTLDIHFFEYYSHSIYFQQTCFHSSVGVDLEKMLFRLPHWLNYDIYLPPLEEQRKIANIIATWDSAIRLLNSFLALKIQYKKAVSEKYFKNSKAPLFQLKDLATTYSGGTPLRSKIQYYENGDIPWMKSGEVNKRFIYEVEEKITRLGLENSSAKIVPEETIVLALYGATAGKMGILKVEAAINQAILAIIPNEKIERSYLFHVLESGVYKILKLVQGAQPNLSAELVKGMEVLLPSKAEQLQISALLDCIDKDIFLTRDLLQKIQIQKKGLLQQLLTGKNRVKL